jgi:glycosyltransferase involved in cell wall biosynthesis
MKINWWSNSPWAATGYGNQTRVNVPRIRALGHEMSMTSNYGLSGATLNWDSMPVFPLVKHPFGLDAITAHAVHAGAEAIITLFDVWAIDPGSVELPWFPWFPIDSEPIPPGVFAHARAATKAITMSKFGHEQASRMGLSTFYVPHSVDTGVFKRQGMVESRKHLNLPESAFVVGMVAANKGAPPRKAFFEQIAAFKALKTKHPDALLYLHTDDGTHGGEVVNLPEYCGIMGLQPGRDVIFCDQYVNAIGFTDDYMRAAYNSMDVLMLASNGEGFGIPLIEAQACGTPVITGEWTAMGELCFSGWKIPKREANPIWTLQGAFQWQVMTGAVAERLFAAYEMRGNEDYRSRARTGALAYDADKVAEKYWKPVLAEMERMVHEQPKPAEPVRIVEAA